MLIVFCPCVIVLATPTALVAVIGNAAMRGSLIKKGATVEALSQVDTIIFDKTGTLTAGKPRLLQIIAQGPSLRPNYWRALPLPKNSASTPWAKPWFRQQEIKA